VSPKNDNNEKIIHVIQFAQELFNRFPEFLQFNRLIYESRYGILFPIVPPKLREKFELLESLSQLERFMMIIQIFMELVLLEKIRLSTISFFDSDPISKGHDRISRITSFILNNLEKSISLKEVAILSGLSAPSFCRWFKRSVGNSFVTFLNKARIEKACQYLVVTDLNVSEIAYKCGFESVSHFNRTFRFQKNENPRKYRLNNTIGK